jgi:hypothetical protein
MYFCNTTWHVHHYSFTLTETNLIYFHTIYAHNFIPSISHIVFVTGWWPSWPKHVVVYTKSLTTIKKMFAVTGRSLQCTSRWRCTEDISVRYTVGSVATVSEAYVSAILLLPILRSWLFDFMSLTDTAWKLYYMTIGYWFKTAMGVTERRTYRLPSQCTVLSLWNEHSPAGWFSR